MKPITLEWINKAEGDWTSAQREYRARQRPNYDASCFHAQQCAEKYLKARLEEAGIAFGRTHNLTSLLLMCRVSMSSMRGRLCTARAVVLRIQRA
jgi:HEPN domain-containing protein